MHLVTTALEKTWPDEGPVLFLGEWCRRYSRRHVWEPLGGEVVQYHWDDRDRLAADYHSLQSIQDDVLVDLAQRLNEIHGVDHGIRYWRILLGPWLASFVQVLYDRWATTVVHLDHNRVSETALLDVEPMSLVPWGYSEFHQFISDDMWNHYVFGRLIDEHTPIPSRLIHRAGVVRSCTDTYSLTRTRTRSWKTRVLQGFAHASSLFVRNGDAMLMSTYMPWRDELRVQRALGQVPVLWNMIPRQVVRVPTDSECRAWSLENGSEDPFVQILRSWIASHVPTAYMEGYESLVEQSEKMGWPDRPSVVFTSNSHFGDEVFKVWVAERVERGAPLVIGQHGGHSGVGRFSSTNDHEIAISDRFFSWGWSDDNRPEVTPIGQLKGFQPLGVNHAVQADALMVLNVLPRYSYNLYDVPIAGQWIEYFEDQCAFVDELPATLREALVVRLYEHDFGWDQEKRWWDRYPDLSYQTNSVNLFSSVASARIFISTYNSAAFLESISMDIPTVVFWNTEHSSIADSAAEVFDLLGSVGIFHQDPRSASRHVASVWNDVNAWWQSQVVREARDVLMDRLSRDPRGVAERVTETLLSLVSDRVHDRPV